MAQLIVPEPVHGRAPTITLLKSHYAEKVVDVRVEETSLDDCDDSPVAEKCQEILSRALQMQAELQDSIEVLREHEADRQQTLCHSIRSLEQSQTVTLLMLGMLNRRVLYDYPSILVGDDSDDDYSPEAAGSFMDEIALLRKTVADVTLAEKNPARDLNTMSQIRYAQSQVDDVRLAFEDLFVEIERKGASSETRSALAAIANQMSGAISASEENTARWSETEQGLISRLEDLNEPVWDVCADVKEMCDMLEMNDFDFVKDEFLRKVLNFSICLPRQWPQATNFRNEVRSDVRSNLGLDKYGELRWQTC